ncbi:MAG: winged helix-turn-helix transcriptional regulator [Woeseiaceae bacterium]|nr:winged helix-turn-helix transcriptional regulator [Woeseiaceae bacterium]
MRTAAVEASTMMKTLGHSGRLMILCHLADGEKSVGELVDLLNMPQSSLSQHLARMRAENFVETRRESQAVYYRLENDSVRKLIVALYDIYCH